MSRPLPKSPPTRSPGSTSRVEVVNWSAVSLRFRRRVRLFPGVCLNLGLHGAGLSVGPRGFHVGMNRRGMYTSAGIPGTGIYAVHHFRSSSEEHPMVAGDARGVALGILAAGGILAVLWLLANLGQR